MEQVTSSSSKSLEHILLLSVFAVDLKLKGRGKHLASEEKDDHGVVSRPCTQ